jgi:hypothetical protein
MAKPSLLGSIPIVHFSLTALILRAQSARKMSELSPICASGARATRTNGMLPPSSPFVGIFHNRKKQARCFISPAFFAVEPVYTAVST